MVLNNQVNINIGYIYNRLLQYIIGLAKKYNILHNAQ